MTVLRYFFITALVFQSFLTTAQPSQAYFMQVESLTRNVENEWQTNSRHLVGLFRQSKKDDLTDAFPDGALKLYEPGETQFRFKFLAWDQLFMPDVVFVKPEASASYVKAYREQDHFFFTTRTQSDHGSLLITIESREHLIQKEMRLFYDWRPEGESFYEEEVELVTGNFIQLATFRQPPKLTEYAKLKDLGELLVMLEDDWYKVRLGGFETLADANKTLATVKKRGQKKAFVLQKEVDPSIFREAIVPDNPVNYGMVKEEAKPEGPTEAPVIRYFIQVATLDEQPKKGDFLPLEALGPVQVMLEQERYKVQLKGFFSRTEANQMLPRVREAGYKDAYVVQRIVVVDPLESEQVVDVQRLRSQWRYGGSLENYYPRPEVSKPAGYEVETNSESYLTGAGTTQLGESDLGKIIEIRGSDGQVMDYPLRYNIFMDGAYKGSYLAVQSKPDGLGHTDIDPITGLREGSLYEMRGERGGVKGIYQYDALQNSYNFIPDEQEVDTPAPYEAADELSLVEPTLNLDSVSIIQNLIEAGIPVWPSDRKGHVAILGTYTNLADAQTAYRSLEGEVNDLYIHLSFEESEFGGIENKYQVWSGPYISGSEAYLLALMMREQRKLQSYSFKQE